MSPNIVNQNIVKPVTAYPKPKIPAWGKPLSPNIPPVASVREGGTPIRDVIDDIKSWFERARAQLRGFNPNSWGQSGPGYFQGMPVPTRGQSAQSLYDQNVPQDLKIQWPWTPKE